MFTKSYTVLRMDQVYGNNKLDVFNRYGSETEVTSFAISRGTEYYQLKGVDNVSPLAGRYVCEYWTSTKVDNSVSKCYVYGRQKLSEEVAWNDNIGVRIAIPLDQIRDEIEGTYSEEYGRGEIKVVIYGEYPQEVLSTEDEKKLNDYYEAGQLKATGKSYSAWGYCNELFYDGTERVFERDQYPEFEFKGKKFVRAKNSVFENGTSRDIWVEVTPVEWLVDERTGLAVTKKCILGGIPLSRKGIFLGDFERTLVQDFLDNEFSYDVNKKILDSSNNYDGYDFLDM